MPELPEVEAVCRRLRRDAIGAQIAHLKILRPSIARPQRPRRIESAAATRTIEAVRRRGKNILIDLSAGVTLHIHMRMTGDLRVIPDARFRPASARAVIEFMDGRALVFNDPRALGRLWLGEQRMETIGVEPLDAAFTPEAFETIAARSRQPVKPFLMDQRRIAGIGNLYAAEILYRARIDPKRPVHRLSRKRRALLHTAIVEVLTEAVSYSEQGYSAPSFLHAAGEFVCEVYGRSGEPCNRCGSAIRRIVQGGRSTCFCGRCQR